jgi:NAD(P)-dependent dehydrogenase (short-subunit alcohol dehydrogenase family)
VSAATSVALVTGAGRGIGRSVAVSLAEAGYAVALAGRTESTLAETAATITDAGGVAKAVVTDVSDEGSVQALFDVVRQDFGRLDLLFNNAGITAPAHFEDLTLERWSAVVATNLTGSFLCAREAYRVMKDQDPQGGRIINNGSISAHAPRPHGAAYNATKHAVTGLTKSVALDGRRYSIACGQIDIGNAESGLGTRFKNGVEQADGSTRPEPTMDVANVAKAVLYMASLPLDANVLFMTVMATNMPFVGRG